MRPTPEGTIKPKVTNLGETLVISGRAIVYEGLCNPHADHTAIFKITKSIGTADQVTKTLQCSAHVKKWFQTHCGVCENHEICPKTLIIDEFQRQPAPVKTKRRKNKEPETTSSKMSEMQKMYLNIS